MELDSPHTASRPPLFGPHRERVRAILHEHPEIRGCTGPNPGTFLVISGLVAAKVGIAYGLTFGPWWLVPIVAYLVGAFISHALFVMIHECTHDLVFRSRVLNQWTSLLANLPLLGPMAVTFGRYHLQHHVQLGVYPSDPDIPSHLEARLIGRSAWRKALWLFFYPLFLLVRTPRVKGVPLVDRWVVTNFIVQITFDLLVLYFLGFTPIVYLALATWFSISLHPLGARWVQEHFMVQGPQPTYSYYGPLNLLAFNMGYHNEHHDFPRVPWNRLPKVRRLGGWWYDRLASHASWTKLLVQFIFDRKFHLHARMAAEAPWDAAPRQPAGAQRPHVHLEQHTPASH